MKWVVGKWVVGVLALVNVALFLWATGHRSVSSASPEDFRQQVNAASMRLLRENALSAAESGKTPCFRVGPFYELNAVALASQKLDILKVPYGQRTIKERQLRAYRVFLGPYSTESAIEAQRGLLRENGITDLYLKREPGGTSLISLGLFSQRQGAEDFVRDLTRKRLPAQARAEERVLGPTFWLELEQSSANRAAENELRATRWGDPRAKLRPFPCS